MAPQNSTLLHENAELTSELSRYSPISTTSKDEEGNYNDLDDYNKVIHRKKSIDIFSKSADKIQTEDEVPIWICGEPRFISGVTSTTTCNELIQALIDDELNSNTTDVAASRDLNDYVITEKWRDVEQALPGDTNILPIWVAWSNARHEVKFKLKINKNKAGTKIVDDYYYDDDEQTQVKQLKQRKKTALAQLLKRLINQGENIKEHLSSLSEKHHGKSKRHRSSFGKDYLMQSFLCDTTTTTKAPITSNAIERSYACPEKQINRFNDKILTSTPDDELFLLVDDNIDGISGNDSGVHVEYRQYYLNKKLNLAIAAKNNENIDQVECAEATPKRKSISKRLEFDALRQNSFNNRLIKYLCANMERDRKKRSTSNNAGSKIQYEIDFRMSEMYELVSYEEALIKQLSANCEQYHRQNNKYTTKLRLEMCIDEVQQNLEKYAKEIIENELELYRIKSEIHQKCGILYNLQRMANLEPKSTENKPIIKQNSTHATVMHYADDNDNYDNICDATNNKSFII